MLPSSLLKGRSLREIVGLVLSGEAQTAPAGGRFSLTFADHEFGEPKHTEEECREKDLNYAAPLHVAAELLVKETGEMKEQLLFMGDVPIMTDRGTFIINGAERVVVSQLVRSPGAYFTLEHDATSGRELCFAKLIPNRGAWLEFEISNKNRHQRQGGPPPEDAGHDPAPGARLLRRRDFPHVRRHRARGRDQLHPVDPGQGARGAHLRRGARGLLPAPAAGRALGPGQRQDPPLQPVLQPAALRPSPGGPVQAEPQPGDRHGRGNPHPPAGGHRVPRPADDQGAAAHGAAHRHRPPRQPARARRRRAHPEPSSAWGCSAWSAWRASA